MSRKSIKARDGYILTDGKIYGIEIFLAEGTNDNEFQEISMEQYNKILEDLEQENDI